MRKFFLLSLCIGLFSSLKAQSSEDLIPRTAVTVFSLNNISLFDKVSMDDIVSYEFMTALQSELFDGSTNGKTIKDAGIDFNQKMNIFYGKNDQYELSGFTFGINDKSKLFTVFDDFDRKETMTPGVEYYNNYFNHVFIQGNVGILIRVDASQQMVSRIADSIWETRGIVYPWNSYGYEYQEEPMDEEYFSDDELINDVETDEKNELSSEDYFAMYYEFRDSLEAEMMIHYLQTITDDIFISKRNLKESDSRFAEQLTKEGDGIFYMDNGRNFTNTNRLGYFQRFFPRLYEDLKDLYAGNILLGTLKLNETSINVDFNANYSDALGSIYKELNSAKFDKSVLKYIPKNNDGFFTYNIDLEKGYERAYDIIMPLLAEERDPRISANVLIIELMNELVNKDKVFNTYKGSMFGTFNGVKKVKTKRIEFFYDEETFEYGEREIVSEENMPVFTLGFTTADNEIPMKILRHLSRLTSQFKNMGDYWVYEDAILGSLPLYMINKNGLFIFTNDEDLAVNHNNGYGKEAISGTEKRMAKKSGSMYAYMNTGAIITELPIELFADDRYELLESMRGKQGLVHLTSGKTTRKQTKYQIHYDFDKRYQNGGKYLLDLINTAYILSKQ